MHWLDRENYRGHSVGSGFFDFDAKVQEIKAGKDKINLDTDKLKLQNTLWDAIMANLLRNGFPENILPFATAQTLMESNNARSPVAVADHNYSGIKYRGRAGTTQGRKSPEGDYYAHYPDMSGWARDFLRIISMQNVKTKNSNGGPAAVHANDLLDYVHRLKVNGYFGASELSYYNLLKAIMGAHARIPEFIQRHDEAVQTLDKVVNTVEHPFSAMLPTVPAWVKVGGGIVLGLIVLKSISK